MHDTGHLDAFTDRTEKRRLRALASARRHSWLVLFLKASFVVLLVAMCGGAAFLMFRPSVPMAFPAKVVITGDGKIVLTAPVVTGVNRNGRPYKLTAEKALQSGVSGENFDLDRVDATIDTPEAVLNVSSDTGNYSKASNTVSLHGNVVFKASNGARLTSTDAVIDMSVNNLHATGNPVMVTGDSSVSSDAVDILDNGAKAVFVGNVRSVFTQAADATPPDTLESVDALMLSDTLTDQLYPLGKDNLPVFATPLGPLSTFRQSATASSAPSSVEPVAAKAAEPNASLAHDPASSTVRKPSAVEYVGIPHGR